MAKLLNQKSGRLLIAFNILTAIILAAVLIKENYPSRIYNKFLNNNKYQEPAEPDCQYPLSQYDFHYRRDTDTPNIIMLGNSLIRNGNWDSLLNRKDVINRGISGDNLKCICERLAYLKNSTAKIIFIEHGINDIPENNINTLFNYYRQIVDYWHKENKIPVINLLFYISPKAGEAYPSRTDYASINKTIKGLNDKLRHYAIDTKTDFIDLNPQISNEATLELKARYTTNGVHLTNEAYKIWAAEINKILARHGI